MMNDRKQNYPASEYASLGVTDTFFLAYRELPALIEKYISGTNALDHGCGGGRSTRFLKGLGLDVVGIDINLEMIQEARVRDSRGNYQLVSGTDLPFKDQHFDLILQSIVMLEIEKFDHMKDILKEFHRVLKDSGKIILITGSVEGFKGKWASFDCDFPENQKLRSGDKAKVIVRGTNIVLYDTYWTPEDYENAFKDSGLNVLECLRPLADGSEPYVWYDELSQPCWDIYVLEKNRRVP